VPQFLGAAFGFVEVWITHPADNLFVQYVLLQHSISRYIMKM
jgi:hypothetical protein